MRRRSHAAPPRPPAPRPQPPRAPAPSRAAPARPEAEPHEPARARPAHTNKKQGPRPAPKPADGAAWLYGRHAVAAALANPARRCRRLVATRDAMDELRTLAATARAAMPPAEPELLERREIEALLPPGAVHQGMALTALPLPEPGIEAVIDAVPEVGAPHLVILLDQVTDPHNVGAILRSAAAFAALAVVVPAHGAPPATGTLAKSASGALETVPLVRVANLARCLDDLKSAGFWCVGLDEGGDRTLGELDLPDRVALVLGAEGGGLRRLTRERCDFLARLPTRGAFTSLNVSNAAAVALYALTRPRR